MISIAISVRDRGQESEHSLVKECENCAGEGWKGGEGEEGG